MKSLNFPLYNMFLNHVILALTFVLFLFEFTTSSEVENCTSKMTLCNDANQEGTHTCSTCLMRDACCNWCKDTQYIGRRCGILSELESQNCPKNGIQIGGHSSFSKIKDVELTDTDGTRDAVQIKPQKIKLKLREGEKIVFNFKYQAAKNYPIQIYYLMDLTNSMKAHKESLVKIGEDLANLLKSLSRYYEIAFGYYADKVAMPFYKMTPADVENPCKMLYGETCSKGFSFVHAMDFTRDVKTFVDEVSKTNFTSNLDDLENGLEPVIQILQCDKHINWFKTSRKMIVIATNSFLHMAGDGILAGVTKKHPSGCILNSDGVLEDYLHYDYPSMEEVQKALERKKVQLVLTLAVKSQQENNKRDLLEKYYKQFNQLIPAVSVFVNENEIIESIKSAYEKVTKKIYFKDNNTKDYLDIKYSSSCNKTSATIGYCENTQAGKEYNFHITVHLFKMPKDLKEEVILISESNIQEDLEITIEYIANKECDCRNTSQNNCSGHGSFNCGQCDCDENWYGNICDKRCTIENCRFSNETYTSLTCNSKGDCDLNGCRCICDNIASGKFCEYNNCERGDNGKICSDNGYCEEGKCDCKTGYTGETCECSTSTNNCYNNKGEDKENVTICGGHGECVCNKCVCEQGQETTIDPETKENKIINVTYTGEYCQHCINCANTCFKYKLCIVANVEKKSIEAFCNQWDPPQVEDKKKEYGEDACIGDYKNIHDQLCSASFILENKRIYYRDNGCPTVQAAGIIIFMPILAIFLCGLVALLVWKAYVTRMDRIEYAKFKKEQEASEFIMSSPLYKDPITEFKNPLHPDNTYN